MKQPDGALYATQLHGVAPGDSEPAAVPVLVAEDQEETVPTKQVRRPSKWAPRVAWTVSMAAIGGVIGIVIVLGMKFIDGPVEATANTPTLAKAQAVASAAPVASVLGGLTFEFSYPGVFDQVGTIKNDVHAVEQYNVSSKSQYSRLIAVSVRVLPSGLLDDDSSFKYRKITPQTYTSGNVVLHGEPAVQFIKADNTERTLFWAHKGRLLTVSITSADPHDSVEAYMDMVARTVRWKS